MLTLHRWCGITIAVVVTIHIAAALYHHFVRKDRVLMRMLTGERQGAAWHRFPVARSADLTFPEVSQRLRDTSILLLPLGAIEQHGPHLPLNTDAVIAEELTRRMIARWGDVHDLWQLPTVSISVSREHDWAPGTLSLTIENFIALVRNLAQEIIRSLPARNLAIVNGHGGNRGVLETLVRDLTHDGALNCCVIHPHDLATVKAPARTFTAAQARPRSCWNSRRIWCGERSLSGCASAPTSRRSKPWCSSAAPRGRGGATIRGSPNTG